MSSGKGDMTAGHKEDSFPGLACLYSQFSTSQYSEYFLLCRVKRLKSEQQCANTMQRELPNSENAVSGIDPCSDLR